MCLYFCFLGHLVQLTDKNDKIATAIIRDQRLITLLKRAEDAILWSEPYGNTIACCWSSLKLPQTTSGFTVLPSNETKICLVRDGNGLLAIKYLPEKLRHSPRTRHNRSSNRGADPAGSEVIIAEVSPTDVSFSIDSGCRIEVFDNSIFAPTKKMFSYFFVNLKQLFFDVFC